MGNAARGDDPIVVPNSLEIVEGNEASEFVTSDNRAASVRYQQVYSSSQFSAAGDITEIRFRPDNDRGSSFSNTLENVRIALSTTSNAPDGLSNVFADNVGNDELVVFGGDLTLTSAYTPGPGGTREFDIVISLTIPFAYDPSAGNLLLDFQRDTTSQGPPGNSFDAEATVGDSISRVMGSRGSPVAFSDGVDTVALVTRFTIVPAPINEPPDCTNAAPSIATIWPPNKKFVSVNVVGVTDPDGDPVTITIDAIFQDEPVGSGNSAPDGNGIGTSTAHVRAERLGSGDGRVYHIAYTADDGNGGTCVGVVKVCVPHDQGQGANCGDGGAIYNSTLSE
jgi:hypothetical protein